MKTILGGGSGRKWTGRAEPGRENAVGPVYRSVEQYDAVLRSHCRLDVEVCILKNLRGKRPDSVV